MKNKITNYYAAIGLAVLIVISTIGLSLVLISYLRFKKIHRPNILFITIDALRADHLSCYGYERNTCPNIDRLTKEGTVFLNCISTGPGTVYSLSGLLTGRYLSIGKDYVFSNNILDKKLTTLSEYLKKAGYYTAAFVFNGHLGIGKGFEQGFDLYRNRWNKGDAEEITTTVLNFLNSYRGNKPFFVWVHYLDAHVPYAFRQDSFKTFENDTLYKENDRTLRLCLDTYHPFTSQDCIPTAAFSNNRYNLNYYIACYDGDIAYIDLYLGKLFENMKDSTMIILTADHGEYLGEHNYYFTHEQDIYNEALHVPLIIKDSRFFKSGETVSTMTSSVDIVPTILSRVNPLWYIFNRNKFNGVDLTKIANGDSKRKYIYSYVPWAYSITDINKRIKYVLNKDGKEKLYFLPDEYTDHMKDTSLNASSVKLKLRNTLRAWLRHYPIRADINSKKMPIEKDAKELLKSLGYLQ